MNWGFNLSYSTYSMYKNSQLQFYYDKIVKSPPDTRVLTVYGDSGQVIHSFAEEYLKNNKININEIFENLWKKYNIDNKRGINNSVLNKKQYYDSIINVKNYIDNLKLKYDNIISEKRIDYLSSEFNNLLIKGYIDIFIHENNKIIIVDWKTNSSNNFDLHELQRKFYSWLCWKKYNIIPECNWVYTKKNKVVNQTFNEQDMIEFNKEIIDFKNEILDKGTNKDNYKEGEWDNIFNVHYKKCQKESFNRKGVKYIDYDIINNKVRLKNIPSNMNDMLDKRFSYFIEGHEFSQLFQGKKWDGKAHCYYKNTQSFALGLLSIVKEFINDYNEHFKTNYKLRLGKDYRDPSIKYKNYKTNFKKNKLKLRYYQKEAIERALQEKIGIIEVGTGGGKTAIASEIIKKLNTKTLFLINRIELIKQTKDVFEDLLGVDVGYMAEGEIDTDKQITVASIQTIVAILKRKNKESIEMIKYLKSINLLIYDECHMVKDAGVYRILNKYISNANYLIGLTGTSFRNDEHVLKMKSLVGDVIYKKTTEELSDEGYISKTKCYFIETKGTSGDVNYHDAYESYITFNKYRNNIIQRLVEKNKDKKILILTKLIKHGEELQEMIEGSKLITSGTKTNDRKNFFESFKNDEFNVLIGSMQIFSQGIDIPALDIIINACANRTKIGVLQSIGRVMRKSRNKEYGTYYDFYDVGSDYFLQATKDRINILRKFGHEIEYLKLKE